MAGSNATPLLEIIGRVVVIYTALLLMVRLAGKREIGELGPLAVEVARATVEPTGRITVIPRGGSR